jgi:thiamine pyrophosphate-dependent acetolactate synthase large subunit-like protein
MLHGLHNQLEVLASAMKFRERESEAEAIPNFPDLVMVALRDGRARPAHLEIPHDIQ